MRKGEWYVGIDIHKNYGAACILNSAGNVIEELRFENSVAGISNFVKKLTAAHSKMRAAIEATGYAWLPVYDAAEHAGIDICLVHPYKTRIIAESKMKTDKFSAKWLAKLLVWGLLAISYVPPKETREKRDLVRLRASLVVLRTEVKNKIHAMLMKNLIKFDGADIFGKTGIEFLRKVQLNKTDRLAIDTYLSVFENVSQQIKNVEREIAIEATEEVKLLMSIPGIDYYSASLICSEIGEINRFSSNEKLASWIGIVPSIHQSGETNKSGHITKQGSKRLRWILVQCAHVAVNTSPELNKFYERIAARRGSNKAIVAVARKLVKIIYAVLTTRQKSNYTIDKNYETKLKKLERIKASALSAPSQHDV